MAKLTESTNWTGSFTITSGSGKTVTLDTDGKYVAKDIAITMVPQAATPKFDGGTLSGSASGTYTNATTSGTDTSGVKVVANAKASRTAVLYNGAVNGWVNKADNTATEVTAISNQALTAETKYITGVDIKASKNFDITVPNGDDTVTFNFAVDDNGNVLVT
jgi:hypothetical protein